MKPRALSPSRLFSILVALLLGLGGISAAQAQQVQVTAADPSSAAQGTINLNVRVTGKGFKNGAKAKWFVAGTTDTDGVQVNSTTFVHSGELTANITVSDTAAIANFDIQVLNTDGRGGKGTELFKVTSSSCGTDVTNLSVTIYKYTDASNTATYNLQPDQTSADGSPVPYLSGKTRSGNIDARFQVDNCTFDFTLNLHLSKRFMTYKFPGGSLLGTSVNFFSFNIDRVANVPVTDGGPNFLGWCNSSTDNYGGCGVDGDGYFVRRSYGSAIDVSGKSYGLRFNYSPIDNIHPVAAGTAYVKVYHNDVNTWTIIPDQALPPSGVNEPNATAGEWSVLLDRKFYPATIAGYQKTPFKILVKRF